MRICEDFLIPEIVVIDEHKMESTSSVETRIGVRRTTNNVIPTNTLCEVYVIPLHLRQTLLLDDIPCLGRRSVYC